MATMYAKRVAGW